MTRTNLKLSRETKRQLDDVKRDGETWDECLKRLVQLEYVSRLAAADPGEALILDEAGGMKSEQRAFAEKLRDSLNTNRET